MQRYLYSIIFIFLFLGPLSYANSAKTTSWFMPQHPPIGTKELLLNIYVNKIDAKKIFYLLQDRHDKLWISQLDLQALNFNVPTISTLSRTAMQKKKGLAAANNFFYIENQRYYQLDTLPGLTYKLDNQSLILYLDASPRLFPTTIIDPYPFQHAAIRPHDPGEFLNYDLFIEHSQLNKMNNISALSEVGYFNQYGIGLTDALLQSIHNGPFPGLSNYNHIARLNTTWTLDQPEKMAAWRFGDSITRAAEWSNAVHFAGIQYAANFATQPGFVTFPTPAFHGEALVPTTIDILVNHAMALRAQVNSGDFSIPNVPVVTGAGTVVVTTQNILGEQTLVSLPYYTAQNLLKPGVTDFSYELGLIRHNYGINSFDYGRLVTAGTFRKGLADNLTVGCHGELLAEQQTLGISNTYLLDHYGTISSAIAASHSRLGQGGLLSFGFQRQTLLYSYGITTTTTSKDYSELGIEQGRLAPKLLLQAFYNITPLDLGSFSMGYIIQKNRQSIPAAAFTIISARETSSSLITIGYNRNLFNKLYFSLSALVDTQHSQNNQVLASFIWSLSNDVVATVSENHQTQEQGQAVDIIKNLPFGNGYGYRLHASTEKSHPLESNVEYQNNYGTYKGKIARNYHETNYQIEVQGGVVKLGEKISFSREIQQSFALIEVPGAANVAVYNRNQMVGQTDKNGNLFIPFLLPYQTNDIRIDAKDLPLDMQLAEEHKEVVPYFRSGIRVRFPVKQIHSAVFKLFLENDRPVPAGVTVLIKGLHDNYFVGDHGQVYIDDLPAKQAINGIAKWNNQRCYFNFMSPILTVPEEDIGNVPCRALAS